MAHGPAEPERYPFDPPPPEALLDPWSFTAACGFAGAAAVALAPIASDAPVQVGLGVVISAVSGVVARRRWERDRVLLLVLVPIAIALVAAGIAADTDADYELWVVSTVGLAAGLLGGTFAMVALLVLLLTITWLFFGPPIIMYLVGALVAAGARRVPWLLRRLTG